MADQGYATFQYIIIQYYTHVFAHCPRHPSSSSRSVSTFILRSDNITSIRDIVVEMTAKNSRNERNVMYALRGSTISLFAILNSSPTLFWYSNGYEDYEDFAAVQIYICDVSSCSTRRLRYYGHPFEQSFDSLFANGWAEEGLTTMPSERNLHNSKATFFMCVVHRITRWASDTEEYKRVWCEFTSILDRMLKWSVLCVRLPIYGGIDWQYNRILFSCCLKSIGNWIERIHFSFHP